VRRLWVLQVLQAIQVLQAPGYGRLCDFQMVLKLSVAANTSVQGVLQVLQAIQVLQAMGFPDQAMGLSDDIEMESNRRVRDPCDPGSVSDLIAMDFQMILKLAVAANRIHGVESQSTRPLVILVQCLISLPFCQIMRKE